MPNKRALLQHAAFNYQHWTMVLKQVPISGLHQTVNHRLHGSWIDQYIKKNKIKYISLWRRASQALASTLAKVGKLDILNPLESLTEEQTKDGHYISIMQANLKDLKKRLIKRSKCGWEEEDTKTVQNVLLWRQCRQGSDLVWLCWWVAVCIPSPEGWYLGPSLWLQG